jgi:tetratricopeptide (TPR) repeat protein
MRLTSSFAVFRTEPGEQDLSRARWLAREGRILPAEREYREALARRPDLATGWMEVFELVRRDGRFETALAIAEQAQRHFGPAAAMPLALRGAALAELGRVREAIGALEGALERDGNLALAWHELAYAAFRVGESSRALLALDRAFALEPHTDTLMLRGRILREAGQYEAALIAFDAAMQASDHEIPQRDAQREGAATRRAASLGGRRPREFSVREKLFADTGAVVLVPEPPVGPPLAAALAAALASLPAIAGHVGWRPAAVAGAVADDTPLAASVAAALGSHAVAVAALDPADQPFIVTLVNGGTAELDRQMARLERWKTGATFALIQVAGAVPSADVVGALCAPHAAPAALEAARLALAQPAAAASDPDEAARLAASPDAPWRRRQEESR